VNRRDFLRGAAAAAVLAPLARFTPEPAVRGVTSAVNYLYLRATPYLTAAGKDADITMTLVPKGTGRLTFHW
jgi:TAT (twin-arginine translocation) pathway-exported protein